MAAKKDRVHADLHPIFTELEGVNKALEGFAGDTAELHKLHGQLNKIDTARVNGAFVVKSEVPLPGQSQLHALMQRCYALLRLRELKLEKIEAALHPELEPLRRDLEGILAGLKRCKEGKMDKLPRYQGLLDNIDGHRVNGVFIPPADCELKGDPLPGQAVLMDLLNEAYDLSYDLRKSTDEPPDKKVAPELEYTRRSLHALSTAIDAYHGDEAGLRKLQGMVNAVQNSAVGGVFGQVEGKAVPVGQGTISALMNDCFEKIRVKTELLAAMDAAIHPSLRPIKAELDGVLRDIHLFGSPHDEQMTRRLQGRVQKIDSERVQGVFIPRGDNAPSDGSVPPSLPGQGALHDTMSEAFTLIENLNKQSS
eukprot:Selendium_serpulae@DN2938_c0_g1_i1.p1